MNARTPDQVPEGEREQAEERIDATESIEDAPTPLEDAEMRRRLALEVQAFENGIEG